MPIAFNFSAPPFDCLTPAEQRLVRASVDVARYSQGATVLELGAAPSHLFVISKGHVAELDGDEVLGTYAPDECFDGRAIFCGQVNNRFVAVREVEVYRLTQQVLSGLIAANAGFGAGLFFDFANRLHAQAGGQGQHPMQSLAVARVDPIGAHDLSLAEQIEAAPDLPRLSQAAEQITHMIGLLHRNGTRISLMARLVQKLNAQLFERAWRLIAPADLVANSCLFVMGSEGRAEQLLKTDQDNGLILRDGYPPPADLKGICQRFSKALRDFGYPDCPGGIMVSNPDWCKCLSEFAEMTQLWLLQPGPDSLMKLAIFMDAHAICGDETLLQDLRHAQTRFGTDNDPMLARFASAIDTFGSSNGWWNRLLGLDNAERMNLKKEGIFPLVHGIRSLALAHQVMATGTVARIEALVFMGKLPAELGTDLTDSLHFFMGLKLQAGLAELDAGRPVSGAIEVARLSGLDREVLKFALGIVRKLRGLLHLRFRLDIL
jgi:signal-transduction protein with cAMP-binding, CBS, and nucleotidyltransferase domain